MRCNFITSHFYLPAENNIHMKKTVLNFICIILSIVLVLFYAGKGTDVPVYTSPSLINAIRNDNPKAKNCIRIMTYNLLSDGLGFDGTDAASRSDGVTTIINALDVDVLSLQEMSKGWFSELHDKLTLSYVSPVRTVFSGNMTTILYNKSTLSLICKGERAYSNLNDSRLRRFVWAQFKDKKTGIYFIVANTHLDLSRGDNSTPLSQAKEMLSLTEELHKKYSCPIFITGDFNSDKSSQSLLTSSAVYQLINTCFSDCENDALFKKSGIRKSTDKYMVDHIFTYENESISAFCLLSYEGFEKLSDHYPLYIDFIAYNYSNKS